MAHKFWRSSIIAFVLLTGVGCASAPAESNPDPFESANRVIFTFNDTLDKAVLSPIASGYEWITPEFMVLGIRNFFANLYDFNGMINAVLQGKADGVAKNGGRFLVNSTLGMFGFVDVASEMGVRPYRTDFGHTLATWGLRSGPYLMVPFFGPRTVRSGTGTLFDSVASIQWQLDTTTRNWLFALEIIDNRAALGAAEGLITGDRYIFVRDAYLQQRAYFVNGGVVQDSFSDYEEDYEW